MDELVEGMELHTLSGQTLTIHLMGNGVVVFAPNNGTAAAITTANILACKSVVHVIDTLLITGACFHLLLFDVLVMYWVCVARAFVMLDLV